jgi:hypothetical protein
MGLKPEHTCRVDPSSCSAPQGHATELHTAPPSPWTLVLVSWMAGVMERLNAKQLDGHRKGIFESTGDGPMPGQLVANLVAAVRSDEMIAPTTIQPWSRPSHN